MNPTYFASPAELREWFRKHHADVPELWIGFHKKGAGQPSVTWTESVDQALCFGWIDGIRKSVDTSRYMIRFTPRRNRSIWSSVNLRRAGELIETGLMQPTGLQAFQIRSAPRTGIYAYEQNKEARLDEKFEEIFRANPAAWTFFQAQPPSYRQTLIWWVVSAKKQKTRTARLTTLISKSGDGIRLR